MNKDAFRAEVLRLPPDERVKLGEDLRISIIEDVDWMPTPEQLAEARRRLEEYRRNPAIAIPAESVLERLRARFG
ncbi:MAG: addiction module protein [Pseudorhodoplanes sp.]|uniref:addiction module protein n=1 Tax=Pseudorhodoplanes sp. TaxID=1934341 RepID=UPI003D0B046C